MDCGDPAALKVSRTARIDRYAEDIVVRDGTAHLPTAFGGVMRFNVSEPGRLRPLDPLLLQYQSRSIAAAGNRLFALAMSAAALHVIELLAGK